MKNGKTMKTYTADQLHMPDKRQFLLLLPFALFYTAAGMFGALEKAESLSILQNLGRGLAWMAGSYAVLLGLCFLISNRMLIAAKVPFMRHLLERKKREGKWYIYLLFTALCLLGYLPYYLMYYPTWLNNDAVWQIEQALGWAAGSNHHPYFHTLILKGLFMIGYRLSGSYTGGAAFYTFCQVLIMAMVFAFCLYQLYRKGTRILWLIMAVIFYAFLPINGILTICMGKDEFFTAVLILFMWMTAEFDFDADSDAENITCDIKIDSRIGKRNVSRWIAYFMIGFLLCALRSNGIFIYMGTAFFLLLSKRKKEDFHTKRSCVWRRCWCVT